MNEPENETKGFKVEDKRKFTTDGELRAEAEEVETQEAPEPPGEVPEPEDSDNLGKVGGQEADGAGQEEPTQTEPGSESGPEVGPPPDLGFLDLINMLAGNALVALGDLPEPVSGKRVENLESAQVMIAFLDALKDKTKGNLEDREEKILGDLLYDLRMRFMAKANLIKF